MTIKILHVIEAYGKKADGVSGILTLLAEQLSKDLDISIVTSLIEGDFSQVKCNLYQIYLSSGLKAFLGVPRVTKEFQKIIDETQPDIFHLHGVFSPLQRIAVKVAKKNGIQTILSPHGMLEPWLWDQKGWIYKQMKRSFWRAIIYPTLSKVDYLHSITKDEGKTLVKEFPHHPQLQIPNAVELMEIKSYPPSNFQEKMFVFLGRIHPKKGVDLFIRAFQQAHLEASWRLVIAGPDSSPAYGQVLRKLTAELNLTDRVDFIGPVYGKEKYALLAKAWAVVVPSYSDVVALVNLEAAAVQTPTITTKGTGLHDWAESGGLLVETTIESLTQALKNAATWTFEERQARGAQARAFVQERYSWQAIGPRWVKAYQQIAQRNF